MAGIAALYDPACRREESEPLVVHMCALLKRSDREGPVEWFSGSGFSMGRCRPALINGSVQPAWNEGRTVCAFFHGELFGTGEVRRALEREGHCFSGNSHAELIAHLYEERGDGFIHALNGSFALMLWDARLRRLVIANDRYGLRPLYTARRNGKYLWASSPKAILADTGFPRAVNYAALADFLCLGIPQSNDTIFEGIDEMEPASMVVCQGHRVSWRKYWDIAFQEEETGISPGAYLQELLFLLRQSAERRQGGDLRLGFLLSGGMDSRIVLSMLRRDGLKTFTFGVPFCPDVQYARLVAHAARVPHWFHEIRPDYLKTFAAVGIERTEDLINCNQFHGISIYDEVALQVDALTTGSVGEDIFGHFNKDPRSRFWGKGFTVDRYYDMKSVATESEIRQLMSSSLYGQVKGLARTRFHGDFNRYRSAHVSHRVDYWGMRQQQRRLYARLAGLFPDTLEFRPFFFDNDLVDFAQTIPPSLRWGENSLYRSILLEAAPAMARIPATTTNGLPLDVTHLQMRHHERRLRWRRSLSRMTRGLITGGRKNFYVDYDAWLRKDLRSWAETILLSPGTLERGYWNPGSVARLMEDHRCGCGPMSNTGVKLTALISFELWCRIYLDGREEGFGGVRCAPPYRRAQR
ncbi:MAG: asparagine synthetase B [Alphaproteobacteria bacterium]|uniref:asparagine synthase (glutamine-hydrolyzing) n=1 Tax=Candidatus Nitrobium versatile TaxID=2884831 RepID=A0A953M236_9BACT|nr:asparagine synthetase B [Candidatus Nitrobium versatile]